MDKHFLVAGADGFIGSNLVERLLADSAQVRAHCFYNSIGSADRLDESLVNQAWRTVKQDRFWGMCVARSIAFGEFVVRFWLRYSDPSRVNDPRGVQELRHIIADMDDNASSANMIDS